MGLATLPQLTAGLIGAGLSADTPACAVQEGTAPGQRVVRCALGGLADAVLAHKLRSPTLVFIGGVVSLLTDERMAQAAADAAARADGSAIFKYLADGPASTDPLHVAALRRGALITPHALV
jgi:precorrin-4 methylase